MIKKCNLGETSPITELERHFYEWKYSVTTKKKERRAKQMISTVKNFLLWLKDKFPNQE